MLVHEQKFVDKLKEDIGNFEEKSSLEKCVLVFPPFLSKFRYLAHQVVDEYFFPTLSSFSIGVGDQRRVIVISTTYITSCCLPYRCVHDKLSHLSKDDKPVKCICATRLKSITFPTSVNLSMPSSKGDISMKSFKNGSARKCSESVESNPKQNVSSLGDRHKRPDKQLYVPRALRGFKDNRFPIEEKCESFEEKKSPKPKRQDLFSLTFESNSIADSNDSFASDTKCSSQPVDDFLTVQSNDLEMESINCSTCIVENVNDTISIPTVLKQDNMKTMENNHLLDASQGFVTKLPTDNQNSNTVHACDKIVRDDQVGCGLNNAQEQKQESFEIKLSADQASYELNKAQKHKHETFEIELFDSTKITHTFKNVDKCDKIITETCDQVKLCTEDEDHDSWETKFNDDGECLNPDIMKELSDVVGRTKIHPAQESYSEYQPISEGVSGEYDNIVELHGFPKEFTTADLVSALSFFQQSSYTIKWVDDSHALALFSSSSLVHQALQLNHPFVKTRPLSEGISESKAKARWCAYNCQPSKPRPATSAVLARRLVSGALGLKVQTTKEQREMERSVLKEAKEKRKLKAKQRQDIWNGLV